MSPDALVTTRTPHPAFADVTPDEDDDAALRRVWARRREARR